MTCTIDHPAPDFDLPATGEQNISLSQFKGKNIILYFYPKDNTSGCTQEGQDFRDNFAKFKKLNTVIFGISRDSVKVHEGFKAKHEFPFELISDKDEVMCKLYDVIKMKNMYGKKALGVERSTFLIDQEGVLRREWRKVKVKEHIEEVLQAVKP
jgi:thioredoxin-dependent peroxiredoxin